MAYRSKRRSGGRRSYRASNNRPRRSYGRAARRGRSVRRSRAVAGGRTIRLVVETQPTPTAVRTDHGFAVAAPPANNKPKF